MKIDLFKNTEGSLLETKILLIGSMFTEKIPGENYRIDSYNKLLEWIFSEYQ